MKKPRPIEERLVENSEYVPGTGCLIWRGRVDKNGYPEIKVDGRRVSVRPLAYAVFRGEPLHSDLVSRPQIQMTCGDRCCIHPDHMTVKSDEDRLLTQIKQEVYQWAQIKADANSRFRFMTRPEYIEAEARKQLEVRIAASQPPSPEIQDILDRLRRRSVGLQQGHDGTEPLGDPRPLPR